MPSQIRVLDDITINKIAAGEVIENPASVVKELIDNSIDAEAKEICIEISCGGRSLIRVSDDGLGMSADDALLCLERHATSKIQSLEDIYTIGSMGFRGEAVPSIASVSKFSLITCKEGSSATLVKVEGGRILQQSSAERSRGTSIEVRSLFFNVPVRKKFQRSPQYDSQEILQTVQHFALAYPQLSFRLVRDNNLVFHSRAQESGTFLEQLKSNVKKIIGSDFCENNCPVSNQTELYSLQGFTSTPTFTKHNRTGQYLYVNSRPVWSPLISQAVSEAYSTRLATRRHPIFVLHFTLPPSHVDINVHPRKKELRFRHEFQVKDFIKAAIDKALQETKAPQFSIQFDETDLENEDQEEVEEFSFSPSTNFPKPEPVHNPFSLDTAPTSPIIQEEPVYPKLLSEPQEFVSENVQSTFYETTTSESWPVPIVLATVPGYILIDIQQEQEVLQNMGWTKTNEGVLFIDQQAAHSRILFERLLDQENKKEQVSQALLIPFSINVNESEKLKLEAIEETLYSWGFSWKIHENTVSFHAVPSFLKQSHAKELLLEMIQSEKDLCSDIQAKQIASRCAIRSMPKNKRLSKEEASLLLRSLRDCSCSTLTALGKPSMFTLSKDAIEEALR